MDTNDSTTTVSTTSSRSGRGLRRTGAIGAATTLLGGSAVALVGALAGPAGASTFTVTQSTDDGTGTISGTLSWAIAQAELDAAADTIDFSPSLSTITFSGSAGQVQITKSLAIRGPGSSALTIELASHCGFETQLTTGESLALSGVKITGGSSTSSTCGRGRYPVGGAFLLYGWNATASTVTISDVTFDGNYSGGDGGGLACSGNVSVTIEDSTFSANTSQGKGGATSIDCNGDATITGSVLSGNSALYGAGAMLRVPMSNTVTITDSSIVGNTANYGGGGLYLHSGVTVILDSTIADNTGRYGAGIMSQVPTTITQSTITGNTASRKGGGVMVKQGILSDAREDKFDIVMSTISGNTSAQGRGNELMITRLGRSTTSALRSTIVGSIVAGSATGAEIDSWLYSASNFPVDVSNSLLGTVNDTNIVDGGGNTMNVTDPQLGALADNGGATRTMLPNAGSPAIDAGPVVVPTFPDNTLDQRGVGFPRVSASSVDIGAVEVQNGPGPTTSTTSTSTSTTSTSTSTSTTSTSTTSTTTPTPTSSTSTSSTSSTSTSSTSSTSTSSTSTTSTIAPSPTTTSTIAPSPTTTIDVSPTGPATPIGGQPLELPAGDGALINPDGTVTPLPITQTGPASIEFGLPTIGADLGGTKVDDGVRLDLTSGGNGSGDGFGFQPGSTASVFILSDPTRLGVTTVNPDGTFTVPFTVPSNLAAGGHTVQLQGIGADGQPRALNAGVTVSAAGSALPVTGRDLTLPLAVGSGLLLAGGAGVLASRRTRRPIGRHSD